MKSIPFKIWVLVKGKKQEKKHPTPCRSDKKIVFIDRDTKTQKGLTWGDWVSQSSLLPLVKEIIYVLFFPLPYQKGEILNVPDKAT